MRERNDKESITSREATQKVRHRGRQLGHKAHKLISKVFRKGE